MSIVATTWQPLHAPLTAKLGNSAAIVMGVFEDNGSGTDSAIADAGMPSLGPEEAKGPRYPSK